MLFYPSAPAAARDVVLRVRQSSRPAGRRPRDSAGRETEPGRADGAAPTAPAAPHARARARRALRRRLAQASARIEKSTEYQRSLAQLAELAAGFQEGLSSAQRRRWLTLEEAVLEHTARLNRAYFYAGAEAGAADGRIAVGLRRRYPADPPGPPHPIAAAPTVNALPLDAGTLDAVTLDAVAEHAMALHAMAADAMAADTRLLAALADLVAQLRRLHR